MLRALATLREQGTDALAELFDRYAREILPKKAPKTRRDQEHQLARLRSAFAPFGSPDQVHTEDVARYLDAHKSPTMANREIALLSHIYTKAIRWGLVRTNPCAGVERNKETVRRYYVEHWDFWLAWVYAPAHLRVLMELAYLTGQRQDDVMRIRVSDVRTDGIFVKQGKTGTEIVIGWTPRLRMLVESIRKRSIASVWLVADGKGQRYTLASVRTAWTRLMARCPCERFQFRDIRKKSANDHATGAHLGHRNRGTLASIYRIKPEVIPGVG
jgi:integrase